MSTYSLHLRSELNRRLTINEMDGNFLYLEELALSGTTSFTNLQTDIIPAEDSKYSLGTSASQWKSLHVSGQTIYIGGVPLSTDGESLIVNSINLGTTASPLILSGNQDSLLINGTGSAGATGATGQGFIWRESWNHNEYYISGQDIVPYLGAAYIKIGVDGNSGVGPNADPSNWDLFVDKGATGSPGAPGTSGSVLNGYRGFYAGINRLFGDDPTITQIIISKNPNTSYQNRTNNTNNDDFYVSGLSGSDTIVVLNVYGIDNTKPLKLKDIRIFVEKFVDIILYAEGTLNSDLIVIRDLFYDNIETLTSSLPTGSLYNNFSFLDKSIEYIIDSNSYTTTGTGSGTFSISKSTGDNKGYFFGAGEGGPSINTNFTYGFQSNDIINISGTALGGTSPANDAEIYVRNTNNGYIDTFEIFHSGTGYSTGFYNLYSPGYQGYVSITTSSTGSVTDVKLIYGGSDYTVDLGEGYTIFGGNNDASILVLSTRDGVINNFNINGMPDYSSPYRNSANPWPIRSIGDGGFDQYDDGNFITTDKSITEFIGSIQNVGNNNNILTVTEIISGTLSVGQLIKHELNTDNDLYIITGTLDGGIGEYRVSGGNDTDASSRFFTAYGINYGAGEVIEDNSFGTSSSYITLFDESIFVMVAINTDIDKIWFSGNNGADGRGKKEVNVLIGDGNTLSLGDTKLELSNKDLFLPETDTLGWMSVFGPLYNYDNDINFTSVVIDIYENTYSVGSENDNSRPIIVKFNKTGDVVWSISIYNNDVYEVGRANSIKIDPVNGDLIVLCETYVFGVFTAEGLIVRIDAETARIKKVNRLRDINILEQQGDLYLYDMTFNSNNELIVVGRKDSEYSEWIIGTSSVLLGSTFSTLVISPSSIDNNSPDTYGAWSIAGTGIIGDENLTYVNIFFGVTGSLTPGGSNASFTILADRDNNNYTILSIDSPGTGYSLDILKPIIIPGTSLGGITPDNDATIIQTDVLNGGIVAASITGNAAGPSPSGTQSFSGVTGSTIEGLGVIFDIFNNPTTGLYSVLNITGQQSGYVLNDIITIPGSLLGGTISNDCTLVNTSSDGTFQSPTISGTGSTSSLYLTINTSVDFSASGTWSIYKSIGGEAYIYTENWERTLGGNISGDTNDKFNSVVTDIDDNIYAVGEAWGGEVTSLDGYQIAILSKFKPDGTHLWTKALNEVDFYCSGKSVAILGTNSIVTTHYSDNSENTIISKLTTDGELLWQKRTDGYRSNIITDANDSIYVLSDYYNNGFQYDALKLFKLNKDGVLVWNNTIGGKQDYNLIDGSNGLSINNDNTKLVIAGFTDLMSNEYSNGFVASLPTDGSLVNYYSGTSNYFEGNYSVLSLSQSYYDTFTPLVGTHSITYSRDFFFYNSNYNIDNNIEIINDTDNGIVFSDGTKQTSSAGIIPQNYQPFNYDYYLQLSDIGKHIYKDDGNGYCIYIPTNRDVAFPIGTAITVVSGNGWTYFKLDDYNITELWGAGLDTTSNNFYIPNNSMATLLKIGVNKWMISGAGLAID